MVVKRQARAGEGCRLTQGRPRPREHLVSARRPDVVQVELLLALLLCRRPFGPTHLQSLPIGRCNR